PLNNGIFVMGHPKFHEHLYQGEFKEVKVLDNKYYNVHVKSMRVGQGQQLEAPVLAEEDKNHKTNGIIDSGASLIVLPHDLFNQMLSDLININPSFDSILEPYRTFEGIEEGVDLDLLDLQQWPSIYFVLEGTNGEDVELELKPENYWQIHAPRPNQAAFQFIFLKKWPNQCIFGLPLMASYFTIFDRQEQDKGVVLFAEKPKLPDLF
ncbi:MAG: pepsin-like aspartyl protease, partial [Marinicella sp.]